jgi:ectonucleotide pyrophosphatase/phosphodiesterase family protein 1/3
MLVLHRYDNNKPSIHSFFTASGPLVKHGQEVQSFDTVDNYTLFSAILSVTPEPSNGTFVSMGDFLKDPPAITQRCMTFLTVTCQCK